MTKSNREILEEAASFRPSLEKEKVVVDTHIYAEGEIRVFSNKFIKLIGKRVRVTIEEIE
jgi:hypothetical protein